MKKRITALAVTAAVFMCQLPPIDIIPDVINAAGEGTGASAELQTENAFSLKPGDKVYADISVSPMVCSTFSLNADWDTDCLELTNAVVNSKSFAGTSTALTYVPFTKSGGTNTALPALAAYQNKAADEVCVFAFSSPINVSCSGTAATLEFTVKDNAENGITDINVYFDSDDVPKYFGAEHKEIAVPINQSTDEEHDGTAEAEITGGVHVDTGLVGLRFGISRGILEPEFSQDVREYTFTLPENETSIPAVTAAMDPGVTADITQASDLDSNNTAVVRVHGKKDHIYKVKFVRDQSNRSAAPVIYAESSPVMRDTPIYILGSGTIYYTFDGAEPTIYDNVYSTVYVSADILNLPTDYRTLTIKAMAVKEGRNPSDVVTAEFVLPDPALKLSGITVSGNNVPGVGDNKNGYTYQISYKDWKAGNNVYTVGAVPLVSSSSVTAEPEQISFDCTDGKGGEKTSVITVTSADGTSKTYDLTLKVLDCEHSSDDWKYEDTAGCDHSGLFITSCSVCGKVIGEDFSEAIGAHQPGTPVTVEATCGTDGSIITTCLVCGKEISRETIPATGSHSWICTQSGSTMHRECSVCHKTEDIAINSASIEHEHDFSANESIITAATCSAEGLKRIYCSDADCGAYIEETIPRTAHTEAASPEVTMATCTEDGSSVIKCSVCGEVLRTEIIPAYGHSFTFENRTPTCANDIELTAECENGCGAVQTYIIPRSKIHRNVLMSNETGHWYECTACGTKTVPEDHTFDDQYIYDSSGVPQTLVRTCTECEYYTMSEIKTSADPDAYAHQHIFGSKWITDGSKHWKECTSCGEKTEVAVHTEGEGVLSGNNINYFCTVCGQLTRTEKHTHSQAYSARYEIDGAAHWHVCDDCGEIFDRAAHTENEGTITIDASIGSEGEKTYYCSVCGLKMREETIPALVPTNDRNTTITPVEGEDSISFTDEKGNDIVISAKDTGEIITSVEPADIGMKTEYDFRQQNDIDDIAEIYDITLYHTDSLHTHFEEIQPKNTAIMVTIPVPAPKEAGTELDGSKLCVYHQETDGEGNVQFVPKKTVYNSADNTLTFEADHFSIYVIAMAEGAIIETEDPNTGSGSTGSSPNPSGGSPSYTPGSSSGNSNDVNSAAAPAGNNNGKAEDVSSAAGQMHAAEKAGSGIFYISVLLAGTAAAMFIFKRRSKKQK